MDTYKQGTTLMVAHGKCCLHPAALWSLPLGEEELRSLQWVLCHQEVAHLSFCLATAAAWTQLQVRPLQVAARWVSKSCTERNCTTQQ